MIKVCDIMLDVTDKMEYLEGQRRHNNLVLFFFGGGGVLESRQRRGRKEKQLRRSRSWSKTFKLRRPVVEGNREEKHRLPFVVKSWFRERTAIRPCTKSQNCTNIYINPDFPTSTMSNSLFRIISFSEDCPILGQHRRIKYKNNPPISKGITYCL